jgi:hypothetical protein
MHREIGKAHDEHRALNRRTEARQRDQCECDADQGTEWKERSPDITETRRAQESGEADETPEREQDQASVEWGVNDRCHGRY